MKKRVVILGGGPCGLSAAWELSKNSDFEVTVIEKDAKPGGLCITNERNGFRFDLGGHRFISKNQGLVDDVCEMMGDEFLTPERRSVILMGGKEYKYPLSAKDILANMDLLTNVKCFADYLVKACSNKFNKRSDDSFEDWVVNRFGRKLYDIFFGPYTEKLWGISPSKISSDWASQRISLLNLCDVVLRLFNLKGGTPRTYAQKYFYPKKGIGQMFDVMGEVIQSNGSSIIYNADVCRLNVDKDEVKGVIFEIEGKQENIDCDYVISTIPLTELVVSICGSGLNGLQQHTDPLKFRGVRFMNIMVDRPDISRNTWMYVSEKEHLMTRIQEPKRRSPFSAPEGQTSVMLEIPCDVDDDVWSAKDDVIFDKSIKSLDKLGIKIKNEVIDYFSTYVTHGYPVYSVDYDLHCKHLMDYVHNYENIVTCGRQGTFRYIFMDTAMEMGLDAARELCSNHVIGKDVRDNIFSLRSEKELLEVTAVTA